MNPTQLVSNPKKYYLVYQTTNLINNKIYIGVHTTKNLKDGYLGSGKALTHAITKYGRENFKREILFYFDNPEEMFKKEIELVNEEFLKREDVYNLKVGGFGVFKLNELSRIKAAKSCTGQKRTEIQRKRIGDGNRGKFVSLETRLKLSQSRRKQIMKPERYIKMMETKNRKGNTKHSLKTRSKISESHKGKNKSVEHKASLSKAHKGMINIYHPETDHGLQIQQNKLQQYIELGYIRGMSKKHRDNLGKNRLGKITIHNKQLNISKQVKKEDLQTYLDLGYERGMLKRNS